MSTRDYILCADCKKKTIYDGDDHIRDALEEILGDPNADTWTVHVIRCKPCQKEFDERIKTLEERSKWLDCLEEAGVDNWQGLDEAKEIFRESEG